LLLNVIPFLVASITTENHFSPVWIIWVMTARIKPRENVITGRRVTWRRRFEVDTRQRHFSEASTIGAMWVCLP
jgi:hypothetical protein